MSDKRDLAKLAEGLTKQGYELVSTGGSARSLQDSGLQVTQIDELTGFPEMLDGEIAELAIGTSKLQSTSQTTLMNTAEAVQSHFCPI